MKIKVSSVSTEHIKKGKANYTAATVSYSYNGEPRTQKIMSFANPGVFKTVSEWEGNPPSGEVDVTLTKNAQGYSEWAAVSVDGAAAPSGSPAGNSTNKVVGSNYETKEERAYRQVLIVRQSCLAQAVESLGDTPVVDDILERAAQFEEWVFRSNE